MAYKDIWWTSGEGGLPVLISVSFYHALELNPAAAHSLHESVLGQERQVCIMWKPPVRLRYAVKTHGPVGAKIPRDGALLPCGHVYSYERSSHAVPTRSCK